MDFVRGRLRFDPHPLLFLRSCGAGFGHVGAPAEVEGLLGWGAGLVNQKVVLLGVLDIGGVTTTTPLPSIIGVPQHSHRPRVQELRTELRTSFWCTTSDALIET